MHVSRRRHALIAVTAAWLVTSVLIACSSDDSGGSSSTGGSGGGTSTVMPGADVIVTATYDGTLTRIVRVAADDLGPVSPPPNPGGPAVTWTLADSKGLTVATGTVADPSVATTEFADDGTGNPVDVAQTGLVELRVPYVPGSSLTLAPASASSGQPAGPHGRVQPQGLCVSGSTCPSTPTSAPVSTPTSAPSASGVAGLKKIVDNGTCAPFNILLVSEGFQSGEMGSFESFAQNVASGLGSYKGYSDSIQDFNVWVLEVASTDSGITDPGCMPTDSGTVDRCDTPIPAVTRNTAFGAHFGNNITAPRRSITIGTGQPAAYATLANALRAARADVTGFLTNDPGNLSANYGGSADIAGRRFTTSTYDGPGNSVVSVAAHESGHALFGLADEYAYGDTAATCTAEAAMSPPGGRGPFPLVNVTNTASPAPWASVQSAAPIAGAYYCMASFYRPENTCLMKELSLSGGTHNDFCSVCLDHVKSTIKTKETWAKCSCAAADAGAGSDASGGASGEGGGLVSPGGPLLVCPNGPQLVQQGQSNKWYAF
jgi:hypothetical protein